MYCNDRVTHVKAIDISRNYEKASISDVIFIKRVVKITAISSAMNRYESYTLYTDTWHKNATFM